jgi:hypothetical protein
MYLKLTGGVPERYSIGQLRKDNPNTSFPDVIPEARLAEMQIYPYTVQDRPAYDPDTQVCTDAGFVSIGGSWQQTWAVSNRPADRAAENIRLRRDDLLAASDWIVTKAIEQNAQDGLGVQIPVVWLTYRQALRDIPDQQGFPFNVTWPTPPE